jgi:hypothetical protein
MEHHLIAFCDDGDGQGEQGDPCFERGRLCGQLFVPDEQCGADSRGQGEGDDPSRRREPG